MNYSEDGLYARILKQRDMKKSQKQYDEPVKPFDLDLELRKLNHIKMLREREIQSRREQANRKRQEEMNKIFFRKEITNMQMRAK